MVIGAAEGDTHVITQTLEWPDRTGFVAGDVYAHNLFLEAATTNQFYLDGTGLLEPAYIPKTNILGHTTTKDAS
jgi:hypothetical protein